MNLSMDESLAEDYKSAAQIARVLTENWFNEEMYCPNCTSDNLEKLPDNTKVKDFTCTECEENYQLKAKSRSFGNKVANSAYEPKVNRIRNGESPNWTFLRYDSDDYIVEELMIVPAYFMTLDFVEAREPLSDEARRSGWVGSNILLGELPEEARLYILKDGKVKDKSEVRDHWDRFDFMRDHSLSSKEWTNDVLKCVRELGKKVFTLEDMYQFEEKLSKIHPENKHVKAKIRQQLQVLRDNKVLEFVDNQGTYRIRES